MKHVLLLDLLSSWTWLQESQSICSCMLIGSFRWDTATAAYPEYMKNHEKTHRSHPASVKNPKQPSSSFHFSETSSVCCVIWRFLFIRRKTGEKCYHSILVELKIICYVSIENDHLFPLNSTNIFCFHPVII